MIKKSNQQIFNNDFFSKHLRQIKSKAGVRYSPKLNIELPISEIFDGISRNEKFYSDIMEIYGEILREFKSLTNNFENHELQNKNINIRKKINVFLNLFGKIKEYNTSSIPWNKIEEQAKKLYEYLTTFTELLNKSKFQNNDPNNQVNKHQLSPSEKLNNDIRHISKIQEHIYYLRKNSLNAKMQLSNNPFLLLTGSAGSGKTHLLCDLAENRIQDENRLYPTFLLFGENFYNNKEFWQQVFEQLNIDNIIKSKAQFLKYINEIGKKAKNRSLIIIDALNENISFAPDFWKNNIEGIINDIKKYPNIALIVSVRKGFENEVLPDNYKKFLINEEHYGFRFKEWEAVNKFFKEFKLPLPEIPLLMTEFQNPLFLLLFCKAFEKRKKKHDRQIFRGHEGATYIFETYIDSVSKPIEKKFQIDSSPSKNIWDTVIEKIAEEMVNQNSQKIDEIKLINIIENAHPLVDSSKLIHLLENNMLIVKIPKYENGKRINGFDIKFPFQKFSDHLIGRYIFKKYENEFGKQNKNIKTAKKYFSMRRNLGKFLSKSFNRGIIEALSIQCPEQLKGIELFEVAPYLLKNQFLMQITIESFIESIIWRNPSAFSADIKNAINFINNFVIELEDNLNKLLNAFLSVAPIPNHPFNSERLHQHLSKFSMPKRDCWWSTFLHYQNGEHDAVDRLLHWAWSDQDYSHINDESIFLTCIALSWFLTTPNRIVRDEATKGLVCLLNNRINLIGKLLEKFKDVNDPYISERLFAIAYASVLKNTDDNENLIKLAIWVYENIFKHKKPPIHILLRDYARGIIEVAYNRGNKLKINKKLINPPYKSEWPLNIPLNDDIKKLKLDSNDNNFKDHFWAQNSIVNSMQPENSDISSYGDFGRYTFQRALSQWHHKTNKITIQQLSNLAVKEVFDLGYDVKLHGKFDRIISLNHDHGRSERKPERIGKKYQWIAFHKIAALVSDHFDFKGDYGDSINNKYKGSWDPHIRDIDPSFIIQNDNHIKNSVTFVQWKKSDGHYNAWDKSLSDESWIKAKNDIPKLKKLLLISDDKNNYWLNLKSVIQWEEKTPPQFKKYEIPIREIWFSINSYIIKKEDYKVFYDWALKQNFMGRWMPEAFGFSGIFIGEYLKSLASDNILNVNPWIESGLGKDLPIPAIITDNSYINEFNSDCSRNNGVTIKLPSLWLINNMNLIHKYHDGRFFDKFGKLISITTNIFDNNFPSALLIDKQSLFDFLDNNGFSLIWTILGEKQLIGGDNYRENYLGRLEFSGVYSIDANQKVIGCCKSRFVK